MVWYIIIINRLQKRSTAQKGPQTFLQRNEGVLSPLPLSLFSLFVTRKIKYLLRLRHHED
jgi:hypothetical protein